MVCKTCGHNEVCALFPDQDGNCRLYTPKEPESPWERLSNAASQAGAALAEIVTAMAETIKEALQPWRCCDTTPEWSTILETIRAQAWATEHRLKWVKILERTKKRRIRKKYTDRILRAYRESKE